MFVNILSLFVNICLYLSICCQNLSLFVFVCLIFVFMCLYLSFFGLYLSKFVKIWLSCPQNLYKSKSPKSRSPQPVNDNYSYTTTVLLPYTTNTVLLYCCRSTFLKSEPLAPYTTRKQQPHTFLKSLSPSSAQPSTPLKVLISLCSLHDPGPREGGGTLKPVQTYTTQRAHSHSLKLRVVNPRPSALGRFAPAACQRLPPFGRASSVAAFLAVTIASTVISTTTELSK